MAITVADLPEDDNNENKTPVDPHKAAYLRQAGFLYAHTVNSLMTSRTELMGAGLDRDSNRNTNRECGYPDAISTEQYYEMIERSGYARRVNSLHADETWSVVPEIWENEDQEKTPFEEAWLELMFELNVWHYLYRADMLSGIVQFGVLFMGFDDGKEPDQPIAGVNIKTGQPDGNAVAGTKLLFLRAFSQKEVAITKTETDVRSPRYGMPIEYSINFSTPSSVNTAFGEGPSITESDQSLGTKVHWTRVLHVADNRMSSEIVGVPRMQPVFNRLLDLRKVLGGSGEMFWKGAFPGYSFETLPEYVNVNGINRESIKEEFEEYYNGLKRYIALSGMTVKPLLPQVADPSAHVNVNLQEITTALQVPMRIFLGSETGHLASTQDISTWNKRVAKRQTDYVNPMMIVPFVRRLMYVGVLPTVKKFIISWTDLNALTDGEKADISLKRTQAIVQYVAGGAEKIMPAFNFYTMILGLTIEQAGATLDDAKKQTDADLLTKEIWEQPKPGMEGANSDPTKKTNENRNSQKKPE